MSVPALLAQRQGLNSLAKGRSLVAGRSGCPLRAPRQPRVKVLALQIDRRSALDAQWRRQQEAEERRAQLANQLLKGDMMEIRDADEFDALCEHANNSLVVMFMYRPSCGSCKDAALRFEQLREEANRTQARVAFVRHNVETDYGDTSDLSRIHSVRAVPAFLFFDGGAMPFVEAALAEDVRKLKSTFREVLLSRAPSARS